MKCQSLFFWKSKKNNINQLCVDIAQRVVKVKHLYIRFCHHIQRHQYLLVFCYMFKGDKFGEGIQVFSYQGYWQ